MHTSCQTGHIMSDSSTSNSMDVQNGSPTNMSSSNSEHSCNHGESTRVHTLLESSGEVVDYDNNIRLEHCEDIHVSTELCDYEFETNNTTAGNEDNGGMTTVLECSNNDHDNSINVHSVATNTSQTKLDEIITTDDHDGNQQLAIHMGPVQCSICLDSFTKPKLLPCFHTFCAACIQNLIDQDERSGTIACPMCCTDIDIPDSRRALDFQTNFYLVANLEHSGSSVVVCDICDGGNPVFMRCLDCEENYCAPCGNPHVRSKATRHHHIVNTGDPDAKRKIFAREYCSIHRQEEVNLVCKKCNEVICTTCKMVDHQNHVCHEISDAADEIRRELHSAVELGTAVRQLQSLSKTKADCEQTVVLLDSMLESGVQCIHNRAKKLRQDIDQICINLEHELRAAHGEEKLLLGLQESCINTQMANYSTLTTTARHMLNSADNISIIRQGKQLIKRLNEQLAPSSIYSNTLSPWLQCADTTTLTDIKRVFGVEISRSRLNGKLELLSSFTCSDSSKSVIGIAPIGVDSSWIVQYSHSKISLTDVRGHVRNILEMDTVVDDLAVDPRGSMYVSCNGSNCVKCVDSCLEVSTTVTTSDYPRGLEWSTQRDSLLLCTVGAKDASVRSSEHKGQLYDISPGGNMSRNNTTEVAFEYPARIATNVNGDVYVADWGKKCVIIIGKDGGERVRYTGQKGNLFELRGLCCDKNGNILIADYSHDRVHVLNVNGQFVCILAQHELIQKPWSVAIGHNGCLWVGETNGRVKIFKYT
jgi:hypothetical protein